MAGACRTAIGQWCLADRPFKNVSPWDAHVYHGASVRLATGDDESSTWQHCVGPLQLFTHGMYAV